MKRGVWPLTVTILVVVAFMGGFVADRGVGWLNSEVTCGERELAADIMSDLEAHYSPPLARLQLVGMCDDENPYWGIQARTQGTASDAAALLRELGCVRLTTGPIYEDFDKVAAARFRCDLPNVGRSLGVAVDAHGLTDPGSGPGVAVTFLPL